MKTHARLALLLPVLFLFTGLLAQDDEADTASAPVETIGERCVSPMRVRDIDIVDDDTIVVEMRGGSYYMNNLRRTCTGLKRSGSISYEVSAKQWCASDTIRVLNSFGGLLRDRSCSLGFFVPITKEAADFLKATGEGGNLSDRSGVTTTSLPPVDEDEDENGDGDESLDGADETPPSPDEE